MMRQVAPDPQPLSDLVGRLRYKDGWAFDLRDVDRGQGSEGLTLCIRVETVNAYNLEQSIAVLHYMPVPPAAFNSASWQRWLFEQILLVERHECCEFFRFERDSPNRIGNEVLGTNHHVEHPYAPRHGPGHDPYTVVEYAQDLDRRTSYLGEVNPA